MLHFRYLFSGVFLIKPFDKSHNVSKSKIKVLGTTIMKKQLPGMHLSFSSPWWRIIHGSVLLGIPESRSTAYKVHKAGYTKMAILLLRKSKTFSKIFCFLVLEKPKERQK